MSRHPFPLTMALLCTVFLGACHWPSELQIPFPPLCLANPTGSYPVATQIRRLTDSTRPEPATADPDDHRSVVMQLWYPTVAVPPLKGTAWLDRPVAAAVAAGQSLPSGWADSVYTHSRLGLPLAPALEGRFPVVIASHGFGSPRNLYTSLYEDLASRGYIVVSVEHPHDTILTVFPDGTSVGFDSSAAQQLPPSDATPEQVQAFWAEMDSYIDLWVQDIRFVLDQLEILQQFDPAGILDRRMDLEHIGMFGHSFGGAAAAEACWIDSRLDACANLDGIFLGPMRLSGGRSMDKPFMTLLDEYYPLGNEPSPENFFERQIGPAYQLTIAGITHSGFNDLGYVLRRRFGPLPRFDSQFGSLGSGRAIEIIRAYNGAFFAKHLRGQTANLLDGPSAAFPEVTFRSK